MRAAIGTLAKAAVSALVKSDPSALGIAAAGAAIDQLLAWRPAEKKKKLDQLTEQVGRELEGFVEAELNGREKLDAVLGNAEALFKEHGLSAAELADLGLKPERASEELLARGANQLAAAGEGVAGLTGRIVRRTHKLLLDDPETIASLQPAIARALLGQRELIGKLPDEVGLALRRMLGRHLVIDPTEIWRPGLREIYLLRAEYGVVPFHEHRQPELERLLAWCAADAPIAVRVMTGPGGTGKTRLLIELCRYARIRRWRAGFLHRETPAVPSWELDGLVAGEQPLLLVVDYAETKRDVLVPVLRRLAVHGSPKTRVILVARALSDWWPALQIADPKLQEMFDDAVVAIEHLQPIAEPEEIRLLVVEAAAAAYAGKLGRAANGAQGLDLTAGHFANVLFLHIQALALVVGEPASEEQALLGFVLKRERRHWEDGLKAAELKPDLDAASVAQALALSTLADGAATKSDARGLLDRAPKLKGLAPAKRDRLIDLVARLYPGERHLEPMRPDLIGEHLVEEALEDDAAQLGPALEANAEHALTVLTRLAKRRKEAERWLEQAFARDLKRLAEPAIKVAIETGDPIGQVLASSLEQREVRDPSRLERLIPHPTTALREAGANLADQTLRGLMRVPPPWSEDVATQVSHFANNLCTRRRELGQPEAALEAAEVAVEVRYALASARPEPHIAELARYENNRGLALDALGQHEAAFSSFQRAIEIRARLSEADLEEFAPDLADSLSDSVGPLMSLGRHQEAAEAASQSVMLRRKAAETNSERVSDLAAALNNLSGALATLRQYDDAVSYAQESVAIRRKLAQARPDAFRPDLASSLANLSAVQFRLGRTQNAVETAQAASEIYRQLAAARPQAFQPRLASVLSNIAVMFKSAALPQRGLEAAIESVELYRHLAVARTEALRPDLARSLYNQALLLADLGRPDEALAAAEEAVSIGRELAAARPEAFRPELAASLNALAEWLSELGGQEAALAAAEEAVGLYRELAAARPDEFNPELARSLGDLGVYLSRLGRPEAALAAEEEAVTLRRELAAVRPDAFNPDLARSLSNLGMYLSALGRREAALAAAEEAVTLRREPAKGRPDAFTPDLATSLNNLANNLSDLGRREAALAAAEEAVALYRELANARPDAFTPDLAMSLAVLANCLEAAEQDEMALESNHEAIVTLAPSFLTRPAAFAHWMAPMCDQYLERCEKLGREPDRELLAPIAEAQRLGEGGEQD